MDELEKELCNSNLSPKLNNVLERFKDLVADENSVDARRLSLLFSFTF